MASIPPEVREVFSEWADELSETIWPRFRSLVFAAILCVGRHNVRRLLCIGDDDGKRSILAHLRHFPGNHRTSRSAFAR